MAIICAYVNRGKLYICISIQMFLQLLITVIVLKF